MPGFSKTFTVPRVLLKKGEGVAILPLQEYERMKEELEMLQSRQLAKDIEKARRERKLYSSSQVKKLLRIES